MNSSKRTASSTVDIKKEKQDARSARAAKQQLAFDSKVNEEVEKRVSVLLDAMKATEQYHQSVIGQIRLALKRENLLATLVGFILGGFIPIATFEIVHRDLIFVDFNSSNWTILLCCLKSLLVLGGLVFSAKTCVAWTSQAFQDRIKAIAWVILLEGVMILSPIQKLCAVALILLVAINGIATGCNLSLNKK